MGARKGNEHGSTITISTGTFFRILAVVVAVWFVYLIRDIVAMTLVSMLLAALMDPFADAFARYRIPRALAALVVYLVGLVGVGVVAALVIPAFLTEFSELMTAFGPVVTGTSGWWQADAGLAGAWGASLSDIVLTIQNSGLTDLVPKIAAFGSSAFFIALRVILVLILAFYFVVEKTTLTKSLSRFSPPEYQPFVTRLALKTRERMGSWLRGELVLMVSMFVLIYGALSVLGVPYALVLALFAAFLELIPLIGPILAAIPAMLFALGISPILAVIVGLAYFVIQQIEGNILVPKVMQKVAGVNPVVSLLAVLIGAEVAGVVGAVLSIPLVMTVTVFIEELLVRDSLE